MIKKAQNNEKRILDPQEAGYDSSWGDHHGGASYTHDAWNYGKKGYRNTPMPLPKKMYHVTPYPKEILEGGFKAFKKPEEQIFGGHGTYVSFTSLTNAKIYQEGLKDMVRVSRGEYSKADIPALAQKWGVSEERLGRTKKNLDFQENRNQLSQDTIWTEGRYVAEFLKSLPFYGSKFPMFMISIVTLTDKLKNINPEDVSIMEADIPTGQQYHDGIGLMLGDTEYGGEDMKGRYTYNDSENEWRIWQPDLIGKDAIRRISKNWYKIIIKTSQIEKYLTERKLPEGIISYVSTLNKVTKKQNIKFSRQANVWYKIANIGSVPNEPGVTLIPNGMVRRFHVTQAKPEIIRTQGLLQSAAKGIEGPKAIYSWPTYKDAESYCSGRAAIVEFYTEPEKLESPYYQYGDVSAAQILAIHESWHDRLRYAIDNKVPVQRMIDTGDLDYIRAAEEMKKMGLK